MEPVDLLTRKFRMRSDLGSTNFGENQDRIEKPDRICRPLKVVTVPRRLIYTALQWISHRPRSQNISKERTLNPEKDSKRKRPRSHVSLEKSLKNYKPLENWAKPNLLPDVTPQLAYSFGDGIWRVCHVVKPEPREFLAILISQINWPRRGERAGWIAVWSSSLTGYRNQPNSERG